LRYVLFALGAPEQVQWMIFVGVALHGICYDFFFVTGFMYTDKVAPETIRSQAQSLLVFFTQGLGMYIGYAICFGIFYQNESILFGFSFDFSSWGQGVTQFSILDAEIKELREGQEFSFLSQLGQMFSIDLPSTVSEETLNATMLQWKKYWSLPAIMAFAVAVVFFLTFWDNVSVAEEESGE